MNFSYGDRVFFQSEAGYWLGIIECDCFVFIVNEPIKTVLEGMHYLYTEGEMVRIHYEDGWFCEQGGCRCSSHVPTRPLINLPMWVGT